MFKRNSEACYCTVYIHCNAVKPTLEIWNKYFFMPPVEQTLAHHVGTLILL